MNVRVRPVRESDAADWSRMRQRLWPSTLEEHQREVAAFFDRREPSTEVLVAVVDEARVVAFAELSIRSHAEGCRSRGVAYLEGWFVEEDVRGRGIGTALVAAAEGWGRSQGCTEMASDAHLENARGISAHRSAGFAEVDRIVCFRKALSAVAIAAALGGALAASAWLCS